jgi:FMN reductase
MDYQPFILGLGGTTRGDSTSEKALIISLRAAEAEGARVDLVAGPGLELPMYAPERVWRVPAARRLVELYRKCDGLVIASPSYHGSISGLLKNALDYAEDLRSDPRCYFDECPFGLIACGGGWQGAGQTLAALRSLAHALRGWPTPFGATLNTSTPLFDSAGACTVEAVRGQLETIGRQVVQFARMRRMSISGGTTTKAGAI